MRLSSWLVSCWLSSASSMWRNILYWPSGTWRAERALLWLLTGGTVCCRYLLKHLNLSASGKVRFHSVCDSSLTELLFLELECVEIADKRSPFSLESQKCFRCICLNHGWRIRRNRVGSQGITNSRHTFSCLINNFAHNIKSAANEKSGNSFSKHFPLCK